MMPNRKLEPRRVYSNISSHSDDFFQQASHQFIQPLENWGQAVTRELSNQIGAENANNPIQF